MICWNTTRLVLLLFLWVGISVATSLLYIHQLYFSALFFVILMLLIITYLSWTYQRNFRMMQRLVEAIRNKDFTLSFSELTKNPMEQQLAKEINAVIAQFRDALSEMEERCRYYETLLDKVDTSLLVTDKNGQVLWMNCAGVHDLCGHIIYRLDDLRCLNKDFPTLLKELKPGEVRVIRIFKQETMQDMAVTVTEYYKKGMYYRLINLKNIRSILEENEMEAWQKLVRVLTHEIMNSITPIISLSDTLCERALLQGLDGESVFLQSLKTIRRRSEGLMGFVKNYQKLSRLASPVLVPVKVGDWLEDVKKLFSSSDIRYLYELEQEEMVLMMDRSQMEQVMINLLKNAGEACVGQLHPKVVIKTSYQEEEHLYRISVTDNGCGIMPEVLDRIFIPFFTTKPTGSGIGLSLCKQILTMHGGSIHVTSEVGKGSCFTLKFRVR